jgi:hypothetical protein
MRECKSAPRVHKPDAETLTFMADLERSIQEANAAQGRVTTGSDTARRARAACGSSAEGACDASHGS